MSIEFTVNHESLMKCMREPRKISKFMPKRKTNLKSSLKSLLQAIVQCTDKSGRNLTDIFSTLPDEKEYPDYYTVITNPIALDVITDKVENNSYNDVSGLYSDLNLMLENAKIYNRKGSFVYKDAVTLGQVLEEEYAKEGLTSPKKSSAGKNDLKGIINKLWDASQSELFQELPDKALYPDYYQEIENPIALSMIKDKISKGSIASVQELETDLKLMVSNAKQYNAEGSEVLTDAEFLLVSKSFNIKNLFYEVSGTFPVAKPEIIGVGEFKVESFKVNREVYRVGNYRI